MGDVAALLVYYTPKLLLLLVGVVVLWAAEKRHAKMRHLLGYAYSGVQQNVSSTVVRSANEGKLVHVTGSTATRDELVDEEFGIRVQNSVALRRVVEMYQWVEHGTGYTGAPTPSLGGPGTLAATYSQMWRPDSVPSMMFRHPGHANPPLLLPGKTFYAADVTLGRFKLPRQLLETMSNTEMCVPRSAVRVDLGGSGERTFSPVGMYLTTTQGAPSIGDLRASFSRVPCGDVTVVALQRGGSLVPLSDGLRSATRSSPALVAASWLPGPPLDLIGRFAPAEVPDAEADIEAAAAEVLEDGGSRCCLPCRMLAALVEARAEVFRLVEGRVSASEVLDSVVSGERACVWALRVVSWILLCCAGDIVFLACPREAGKAALRANTTTLMIRATVGTAATAATIAVAWLPWRPVKVLPLLVILASLVAAFTLLPALQPLWWKSTGPELGATLRTPDGAAAR